MKHHDGPVEQIWTGTADIRSQEVESETECILEDLVLQYCRQSNGDYIFAKRVKFSTRGESKPSQKSVP